ncbi:MAG TPA: sugar phosphate isomerase/epimerase [Gemmataceae bacterium]|nr:sugar phosphate isomerase/epimerase [Gemmataceae bacterium]
MHLSVLLSSLPLDFEPAVRRAAGLGFRYVDVVGLADRPGAHLEALADSGLLVCCAAVGRGLPDGQTLDAASVEMRRAALEQMKRQVADAARLGATHCYLVPGIDAGVEGRLRFTEACLALADFAARRMVRLCVEHVPGRALPTVAAALEWLEEVGHDNLALLLDIGHCLISGEDPAEAAERAGTRLGYVHLDDNDGAGDLHWPLLTGQLTEGALRSFLAALSTIGYGGALTLELNPANPDPEGALREGRELVQRLAQELHLEINGAL